jgi:hypothetical protein
MNAAGILQQTDGIGGALLPDTGALNGYSGNSADIEPDTPWLLRNA